MEHLQQAVLGLIDHYGYFGEFIALLLGNLGMPLGTELVMPASGALTATGHLPFLWATIAVAVAGELAGQGISYAIGRFGGVPVLERYGKYVGFHHKELVRVHVFFEKYGTFAIFICRFLPVIRGICGYPAGIAEMNLAHFVLWTLLGSAIFGGALVILGYQFGDHLDVIMPWLHKGGFILLGVAVAVAIVIAIVWRMRSKKANVGPTAG